MVWTGFQSAHTTSTTLETPVGGRAVNLGLDYEFNIQ